MQNAAHHLQKITHPGNHRAEFIAVTSGKGGVGKTNIAANLAIHMSAYDKKVLLVDTDLALGNVDVLMNIDRKYNISHVMNRQKTIDDVVYTTHKGLRVIFGASGLENLADMNELQRQWLLREFSKLQSQNDIVVIDTAAGICKSVVAFCLATDHVLVVTTPEATAITDAYAMIKVLAKNLFPGRISLVVNMAQNIMEGKRTFQRIANVSKKFLNTDLYDGGVLLKDERLTAAVRMQKPVVLAYPKSKISVSLRALAFKLSNSSAVKPKKEGLFDKILNLFY